MSVLRAGIHLDRFRPPAGGTAVALGFFDGVHRGHQGILLGARALAAGEGLAPVAFTFSNHPATVVAPERAPDLITDQQERLFLVEALGLEAVWREFQAEFSHMAPADFVRDVLRGCLDARAVSVGPNYRFGYRAKGDPELLETLGRELGFRVRLASPVESGGTLISSTRIREMVRHGRLDEAAAALGRPYRVEGPVRHGNARGARLGTPTANLRIPHGKVVPALGVYAVWAGADGNLGPGVANFGTRPTFGFSEPLLEVHLLDFSGDLYGQTLEVFLLARLRPEQRFADAETLKARIARDMEEARALLAGAPPPTSLLVRS